MVLRFLMRYLANNEKLIQMLADSYPIRKAARFTARMIMQVKYYQEETLKSVKKTKVNEKLNNSSDVPLSSENLAQYLRDRFQSIKRAFEDRSKPR